MKFTTRRVLIDGHVMCVLGLLAPPSQREKAVAIIRQLFSDQHPVRRLGERLSRQKPHDPRGLWEAGRDKWPGGLANGEIELACIALRQSGFVVQRAEQGEVVE